MPDGRKKPSFWETLPGIITAIATLVGAVAALITALYGAKIIGHDEPGKATAKQESAVRKAEGDKNTETGSSASSQAAKKPVSAAKSDRSAPQQGDPMTDPITGMELVYIPKGCFQMGSSQNEKDRDDDEGPVHEVCVDGFWMGKYEVTQGQWKKIMGDNLAEFQKGDNYPVEQVSWNDTQTFIRRLNSRSRKHFRLPTEAEWEYAARAGTDTVRFWGDSPDDACRYANVYDQTSEKEKKYGWTHHNCNDGYIETAPVGSFRANSFGLYDMLGNVWEWCSDWYDTKYYASRSGDNPTGSLSGSSRVLRGGSWYINPGNVRSADRYRFTPVDRNILLGFRLALPVQQGR
ncbi:MAG: formylglycine-generating enzyme family protein [Candidatus Electrothrix sp. MAN1_4]|nr:formylglycine-generating enzyme family protein [Candidatus Electrothrix sp. MAN1_4]